MAKPVAETISRDQINEESLRRLIDACGPGDMLRLGKEYRAVVLRLLDEVVELRASIPKETE